jgi:hypothetical protein
MFTGADASDFLHGENENFPSPNLPVRAVLTIASLTPSTIIIQNNINSTSLITKQYLLFLAM